MDEYARALDQVAGIAVDRKVDAVLIAGDVFDSPAPAARGGEARLRLPGAPRVRAHRLRPDRRQPRPPEEARRARVAPRGPADPRPARGAAARPGRRRLARLARREGRGEDRGPAVRPGAEGRGRLHGDGRRAQVVRGLLEAHRADPGRAREGPPGHHASTSSSRTCWWTARASARGSASCTSARSTASTPSSSRRRVQYIALGHLHRPQEVLAPAKTRYPGSLIELDFGEQEQEKSVVVFDAQPQTAAQHRARARSRRDEGCARSKARWTTCSASRKREATTTCASA